MQRSGFDLPERGEATNAVTSAAAKMGDKMMPLLKCILLKWDFMSD